MDCDEKLYSTNNYTITQLSDIYFNICLNMIKEHPLCYFKNFIFVLLKFWYPIKDRDFLNFRKVDSKGIRYISNYNLKRYNTVINSAVLEHIRGRKDLNDINECVKDNGCLIIHTVICEEIPKNPNWFFLIPVHYSFFTNKSMSILMRQYEYNKSIYCPLAKSWVLFKKNIKPIAKVVDRINDELKYEYLFYKKGFLDYWK